MNKPYRETRIAIFVAPEVGEVFKKAAKENEMTYTQYLKDLMA